MVGRRSYGDILREARERRGFDIASMARKLHIRPDILKAIEEGDFERTPARGYTRNMVRSYAVNLGLDASRITDMYLNEIHAYETGRPMSGSSYSNGYNSYIRHRETGRSSSYGRYDDISSRRDVERFRSSDSSSSRNSNRGSSRSRQASSSRNRQHDPRSRASESRSGSMRGSERRKQTGETRNRKNDNRQRSRERTRSSRSGGIGEVYVGHALDNRSRQNGYPGFYSTGAPGSRSALMDKLPFMGIVAVVAIIVIIILVVLFNGSKQSADNIPDIPISGLTDTSNPEGSINSNVTEAAPTEAVFRYAVDEGSEAWIEIYENDSDTPSFAGVVSGPDEQEYTVTDKLVILTANPGPVHIAVDGTPLEFAEDEDSAYYRCEVDFKEILDNWKKEHPTINISSSSSSSSSSSASKA